MNTSKKFNETARGFIYIRSGRAESFQSAQTLSANSAAPRSKKLVKAAAYIRTGGPVPDRPSSIEIQLQKIRKLAAADSAEIVRLYVDYATSSVRKSLRPGIAQMLNDAHSKCFDTVYSVGIDRLSRNMGRVIEIIESLRHDGIDLRTVDPSFDLSAPTNKFMFDLLASLSNCHYGNSSEKQRTHEK